MPRRGHRWRVFYTDDSGAAWTTAVTPTQETLLGVACATTSSCVAVGSGGTVLTTSDGGTVWSVRTGRSAPAPTLRVLVVGDSFAHTLAAGIARNATAYGVTMFDESVWGCALARGSPVLIGMTPSPMTGPCAATGPGWQALYEADVNSDRPDLSLLVLGPWDLTTLFIDGVADPGPTGLRRVLRAADRHGGADPLRQRWTRVITTVPEVRTEGPELCVPPPASVRKLPPTATGGPALNDTARTVASEFTGQVNSSTSISVSHPTGTFVSTVDGTVVRASDGVHLSEPGGEWLTPWLVPQLIADAR